jgi:hypothetical protein
MHLSQASPIVNDRGESVAYAVITPERVFMGPELRLVAEDAPSKYCASYSLTLFEASTFKERIKELRKLTHEIDTVILSSEAWGNEADCFNSSLFKDCQVPVDLIFVVRPPVELLAAAWWQWGVWTGTPLEEWCTASFEFADYMSRVSSWKNIFPETSMKLIELSQDPVAHTLHFLGFDVSKMPAAQRLNTATNSSLLRHNIRNKATYARDVHEPSTEFYLNNILDLPNDNPLLPFSQDITRAILESVADSSKSILNLISADCPVDDEVKQKYLDLEYYSNAERIIYEDWILQNNSDEFVVELINNCRRSNEAEAQLRIELEIVKKQLENTQHQLRELKELDLGRLRRFWREWL